MNVTPLHPTTEPAQEAPPALTPEQEAAQLVVDREDYATMLRSNVQTLRAELYAAEFMSAELAQSRDVQARKKKFMRAASKLPGALPNFTECALRLIAGKKLA